MGDPATSSKIDQQRLSPIQEQYLVEWITELASSKNPPSHSQVREMAIKILQIQGDNKPLGSQWTRRFLKRNPSIQTTMASTLDSARVEGATYEAIEQFYETFNDVKQRYEIQDEDIWNVDEQGMALGICSNSTVLAPVTMKKAYKKVPQTREWVTVIEAISMNGRKIRPLVIFKGENLQSSWFEEKTPNYVYTTSSNGWTSNGIGQNWLRDVFIPETTPSMPSRWRLLLLDGHGSHDNVDFLWECKQNRVHVVFEPPHTSHILQPLDLTCFSPLKSRYREILNNLASISDGAPLKKRNFLSCYHEARSSRLTDTQIRAGWEAAGLKPWNPQKGLGSKFTQRPIPPPSTPKRPRESFDPEMTPTKKSN